MGIRVSDQGKAGIHSCIWLHFVGGSSCYNIWRARHTEENPEGPGQDTSVAEYSGKNQGVIK